MKKVAPKASKKSTAETASKEKTEDENTTEAPNSDEHPTATKEEVKVTTESEPAPASQEPFDWVAFEAEDDDYTAADRKKLEADYENN